MHTYHKKLKKEKTVVTVNCFPSDYEIRIRPIVETLLEEKMKVYSITSDFDHYIKKKVTLSNGQIQLKTIGYSKNISIKRIISHILFSIKCYKIFRIYKPDYIYINIPPNCLIYFATLYKRKNSFVKLIVDVCDLWPESMGVSKSKYLKYFSFGFNIWKDLRNNYLKYVDVVISECNLFIKQLEEYVDTSKIVLLPMCKVNEITISEEYKASSGEVKLLYLGTINELVDIEKTSKLIDKISEKVKTYVEIIGTGEKKDEYINRLELSGAIVTDHGAIFDENRKAKIAVQCDYGLNIVKKEAYIGLTTKSVDYLSLGLPLINTVGGDTKDFINVYDAGINIENINDISVESITDVLKREKFRESAKILYKEQFSKKHFMDTFREAFLEL